MSIGITSFAGRYFDPSVPGTTITMNQSALVELANDAVNNGAEFCDGGDSNIPDFIRHLFIKNPCDAKAGVIRITDDNRHLLRSGYETRRDGELPYLTRYFEGVEADRAEWLDIVLYSREQLLSEGIKEVTQEWGIVAINAELYRESSPQNPATLLRNALGKEHGGNGRPLDEAAYNVAVKYYEEHAVCR